MKKLYILQLGAGNVGGELIRQVSEFGKKDLVYCGVFTSKGGVFKKSGLSKKELSDILSSRAIRQLAESRGISATQETQVNRSLRSAGAPVGMTVEKALEQIPTPFVLVDTTASDATVPLMKLALKRGGFVVISNKKPIAGSQKDFDALQKLGGGRLFIETTVGAGLPVVSTLQTLLGTGDEIVEIKGCFSGTLGFLFSQIENGATFSKAVLEAKKLGYTEPDPRDDLSGVDVARKALILARLIGLKLEMDNVKLSGLYPASMAKLSIAEFLSSVSDLDKEYKEKAEKAKKEEKVLRFVATVSKKGCKVGLESVDKNSDIGSLSGPDNIIVFKTKRYYDNPLIVKGPGAGGAVTAAGVFGDIVEISMRLDSFSF